MSDKKEIIEYNKTITGEIESKHKVFIGEQMVTDDLWISEADKNEIENRGNNE